MGTFTEEEELIIESVREFCQTVLAPRVQTDLEQDVFPRDVFDAMKEMGIPNCGISPEWGGMGVSMKTHVAIVKEILV